MWKLFWIGGGVCVVLVGSVVWAAASSTFLFRHPRSPDLRVVIDRSGRDRFELSALDPQRPPLQVDRLPG